MDNIFKYLKEISELDDPELEFEIAPYKGYIGIYPLYDDFSIFSLGFELGVRYKSTFSLCTPNYDVNENCYYFYIPYPNI